MLTLLRKINRFNKEKTFKNLFTLNHTHVPIHIVIYTILEYLLISLICLIFFLYI